mmetsp:Transcript_11532/g.18909  ORF Transcript_11532/g.18909 Transcript_11532/m.18909 type:complete len:348 (+) Transcript_11532:45-1088(+)
MQAKSAKQKNGNWLILKNLYSCHFKHNFVAHNWSAMGASILLCLLQHQVFVQSRNLHDGCEHRLLNGWVRVVQVQKQLVEGVVQRGIAVAARTGSTLQEHDESATDGYAHLVRAVVQTSHEFRVDLVDGLLAERPSKSLEDHRHAQTRHLPGGHFRVVQVAHNEGHELGGGLEERVCFHGTGLQDAVAQGDRHFPHRGLHAPHPPDQIGHHDVAYDVSAGGGDVLAALPVRSACTNQPLHQRQHVQSRIHQTHLHLRSGNIFAALGRIVARNGLGAARGRSFLGPHGGDEEGQAEGVVLPGRFGALAHEHGEGGEGGRVRLPDDLLRVRGVGLLQRPVESGHVVGAL